MSEKPYCPSNGTEGMDFMSRYCWSCTRWKDDGDGRGEGCDIQDRSMVYGVGEPEYPKEWVAEDGWKNPSCTAFDPRAK